MFWIALHCPRLALDRVERRLPETVRPALAVTTCIGNRPCILSASASADAAGVKAGQSVASALAMLPDLIVVERSESDEAEALREAAASVLRYTPNVVVRQNGILAEISASVRLFGGHVALVQKIVDSVAEHGLHAATGVAPTAGGAWLFAQSVQPGEKCIADEKDFGARLDRVRVELLESARPHLATLIGVGCRSLADLARLPRSGLARRFGEDLLAELDRAYGRRPDPQIWFEVPETFSAKLELMARVENVEALLFAVKRMIGQLAGWLAARHAAVESLTFSMRHEAGRLIGANAGANAGGNAGRQPTLLTLLTIRLAEASDDPNHLVGLLRERLERTELAAPVEELELTANEIAVRKAPNLELFSTPESQTTTLNRLIEKLSARLGPEAVRRLRPVADHRPEKSQSIETAENFRNSRIKDAEVFCASPRPAWLIDSPLPLQIQQNKPFYRSPLEMLAGPERIEAGWWDDRLAARDYFIAENDLGQLLWVYRERNPERSGWYLHGLFG